jgi:integrase
MRRGELLALRWRNVDLDGKAIRVREALEETKTGLRFKGPKFWAGLRDISLPAILLDVLHEHRMAQLERRLMLGQGKLGDGALVFPRWDSAEPQSPNVFAATRSNVTKQHGIDVSFHGLRHTHASQLIDAKSPPSPSGSGVARDPASKSRLTCSCDASCAASTAHLRFVLRHVSNGRRPSSIQGPAGCR